MLGMTRQIVQRRKTESSERNEANRFVSVVEDEAGNDAGPTVEGSGLDPTAICEANMVENRLLIRRAG